MVQDILTIVCRALKIDPNNAVLYAVTPMHGTQDFFFLLLLFFF